MDEAAVGRCEEILDYAFQDKGLLRMALCHASAAVTRLESNERLEFLGDSVLGLSVCSYLYREHEGLQEGDMTKIKSTVVSRKTCAAIVREMGIDGELILGGELSHPGDVPESIAAGVFEAIIGAMYIDGGYEAADGFILRGVAPYIDEALNNSHQENFKSLLQQHAQRRTTQPPEYVLLDEQGPDHSKCFEVGVALDGETLASAWGRSKKEAEQAAAKAALVDMGVLDTEQE